MSNGYALVFFAKCHQPLYKVPGNRSTLWISQKRIAGQFNPCRIEPEMHFVVLNRVHKPIAKRQNRDTRNKDETTAKFFGL